MDSTGLAQVALSTFLVRWMYRHSGQPSPKRHGLNWLAVVARERQLIRAQFLDGLSIRCRLFVNVINHEHRSNVFALHQFHSQLALDGVE